MEIKTCEQYVLNELENSQNKTAELADELNDANLEIQALNAKINTVYDMYDGLMTVNKHNLQLIKELMQYFHIENNVISFKEDDVFKGEINLDYFENVEPMEKLYNSILELKALELYSK